MYIFCFLPKWVTTAVWQSIFYILLRIGTKYDVIDDIEKYMIEDDVTYCVAVSATAIVSITLIA